MNGTRIRALLARSPLCHELPGPAFEAMLRATEPRTVAARQNLFHQGDAAHELIILGTGYLKVWQIDGSGDPTTIHVLGPGDPVGAVAVFRQVPYPATATALLDCVALCWPAGWMLNLMERHPAVRANALSLVGSRTEELVNRLREMATEPVGQRTARALLRLADQTGHAVAGGVEIGCPLSRQDLAEIVGTDLYSVSRILRSWAASGLVAAGRLRVVLLNRAAMQRIADGDD